MKKCASWINERDRERTPRECKRPGKHEEKGALWCSAHRPSALAAKEALGKARGRAGFAVYDAKNKAREARDALLGALVEAGGLTIECGPLASGFVDAMRELRAAEAALAELGMELR